jgi:LacI family transcriptional regulator
MRQKVLHVIDSLNYKPNFSARQMRTDKSNLVGFGLLADEVITTPYAVDMIRGAQEALWERDKVMLVASVGPEKKFTEAYLEVLLERRVEGIIYAAMYHQPVNLSQFDTSIPMVLANCFSPTREFASVVPDEVSGGYVATRRLLEAGHRRIAFLNFGVNGEQPAPIPATAGRLAGYQQALAEYDIPYVPELVRYTEPFPQFHFQATRELLSLAHPPTAFFCGNDRIALGCYAALSDLGLRIPDDVAVVGFDNQIDIAQGLWPPLTTVQLPHYEMGKWAVEYLLQLSADPALRTAPIQHQIACPLVERASV